MAERIGSVWAIDIGNSSLKALRLSNESGTLEVIGFDHIQHGKILSGTGVKEQEKQELVALSLRQFVQQNDLGRDEIIVAVPSANSFARFVNLPPVEQKRIPEIVKFEASQQIPFDINEVAWDWQLMSEVEAAEAKVGIFAIKNDVVTAELEHYSRENLQVSYVQIAPMALYNYIVFDRPDLTHSDAQATVVLNVGAENTDLVVCTKSDVWQRTIPMGGNAFTKAIAETFKLNFEKAEKLKRTAPMSKYARQILQAMKPVFTDLAAEIQRSLGFYSSSHQNVKLVRVIALGGGTKMRGLLQYLQQSLQMPIERPDSFRRVGINAAVSAAKFHESVCDFGIVYGLAVQGLGLGRIESNLLPRSVARTMAWAGKAKYFVAAACLVLVVSVLAFARVIIDKASYARSPVREKIKSVLGAAQKVQTDLKTQQNRAKASETVIKKEFDLFKYRDAVPEVYRAILLTLPNEKNNPQQAGLYQAFAEGDVQKIKNDWNQRDQREQIFVTGISVRYTINLAEAQFGAAAFERVTEGSEAKTTTTTDKDAVEALRAMGVKVAPSKKGPAIKQRGAQQAASGEAAETKDSGFVVTITGYSPYKNIGELLDPAGAQDDPNRWGVVTRLMHLDRFFDGNSPFELYKKNDKQNFEIKTGDVDISAEMPAGIGVTKTIEGKDGTKEDLLIDPMTKEIISKVAALDEGGKKVTDRQGNQVYQINDHWFVLNLKLKWKDAPEPAVVRSTSGSTAAARADQSTSTPSGGDKMSGKSAGGSKVKPADF
jgi:type IV pilus assembly protein PilM